MTGRHGECLRVPVGESLAAVGPVGLVLGILFFAQGPDPPLPLLRGDSRGRFEPRQDGADGTSSSSNGKLELAGQRYPQSSGARVHLKLQQNRLLRVYARKN